MSALSMLVAISGIIGTTRPGISDVLPKRPESIAVHNDNMDGLAMLEFRMRRPGEKIWGINLLSRPIAPLQSAVVTLYLGTNDDCMRDVRFVLKDETTSEYPGVDICANFDLDWSWTTNSED